MALPSLRIGHHLGDQIPTQPHLARLASTGVSAALCSPRGLVHERSAHPLAHGELVLPGGFNRLAGAGGRQLIATTAPTLLGLDGASVRLSVQAETPRPRS